VEYFKRISEIMYKSAAEKVGLKVSREQEKKLRVLE